MKTSTKNVIITGIFTVIAGFTGVAVGYNFQDSEVRDVMKQNGLVNINYEDLSYEVLIKLIEAYIDNVNKLEEKNEKEKEELIKALNQTIFSENQIWSGDSLLNSEGISADWQRIGKKWYYFDLVSGKKKIGWQQIDNQWYYFDLVNRSMKTGWQQIEGKWYCMTENGECLFNTVTEDGYIVNEKGEWVGSVNKVFEK